MVDSLLPLGFEPANFGMLAHLSDCSAISPTPSVIKLNVAVIWKEKKVYLLEMQLNEELKT
jgi:hypothetical protein